MAVNHRTGIKGQGKSGVAAQFVLVDNAVEASIQKTTPVIRNVLVLM